MRILTTTIRSPYPPAAVLAAAAVVASTLLSGAGAASAEPTAGLDPTTVPMTTPATDDCPHRTSTPPAVDASEVVPAGQTTPTPLPVPTPAVGGERLAGCGLVTDPAAGDVPSGLTSAGWLIADLDSGDVIAAKDPHGRYRPASTIKVLLALTALEEIDLDTTVTATAEDWTAEGDSCGVGPGGRYTLRDIMTGLLMVSGNDCAAILARELGGVPTALEKMNRKAADLGARDTRAASPSGLDAAGMSTSPYDLALIFREAMRNADFRHMIALRTYEFPGYPKQKDVPGDEDHPGYTMGTSNSLLRDGYPGMLGGKTGFTDDARKTFVGAVTRDGRSVLIVQMYGLNYAGNSYFDQAERMLDYGFAAPRDVSVGSLAVDEDSQRSPLHAPETKTASANDSASSGRVWIAVGAVAAVLAAAGAVWLLTVRSRRRD
ncbi:D-alanyl-D-alanine carboxypeptidase family protein [Gordonia shandongensis]|uniref:D-alanyl-D-alanine carboxypeptidase family protein n=1 Tax=Gordonia shandongensis TaxID=376351 RepID=UPI0012EBDF52|nr:D-alanyl-D-alanine carboxypeptidase family protein [Gordonia shandongensis]